MTFTVRAATADDARAIAEIRVQGWREAYSHILSAGFLASQSADDAVDGWRAAIERGVTIMVAERDGRVRGFAVAGRAREADAPRELELGLIYQLQTEHGTGSGQALLDAVLGDSPAFLWTAEDNPRAQAFYRRNGFVPDGAHKVAAEWENLAEIRMVR